METIKSEVLVAYVNKIEKALNSLVSNQAITASRANGVLSVVNKQIAKGDLTDDHTGNPFLFRFKEGDTLLVGTLAPDKDTFALEYLNN